MFSKGTLEIFRYISSKSCINIQTLTRENFNFLSGITTWIYWHPNDEYYHEDGWLPIKLVKTKTGTTPHGSQWAKVNLPRRGTSLDEWAFKDLVEVPESLEPGEYVLSFRWDCQESPQVWNSCANIHIE